MNIKDILYRSIMTYFVLVTCITAAIIIIGLNFDPDAQFGYKDMLSPFKYAFLGIIPTIVMYSSKELSNKQFIIRKIIQLLLVEAELITVHVINSGTNKNNPEIIIVIMISIFLIFIFANLISMINSYFIAQRLTKELMEFQKNAK